MLAFSTQVRGFKPGRILRIFKGEKILSTPFFGGEVKPSVCNKSLNGVEVVITGQYSRPQFPLPPAWISHVVADVKAPGGEKWRHLKGGENNGKLPLRTCPGCSVPEPYQSPD